MSKTLFLLTILLFLNACDISTKDTSNKETSVEKIDPIKVNSHAIENSTTEDKSATSNSPAINEQSKLEDFKGKPSLIIFGSTGCPHCRDAMPEFKSDVWDKYSQSANLWVNVLDGGKFNVDDVAQGLNSNLDFDAITNTTCNYVPSWLILDKNGALVSKSCGGEKSLNQMKEDLENLLIQ